jgi:hypothetical protein
MTAVRVSNQRFIAADKIRAEVRREFWRLIGGDDFAEGIGTAIGEGDKETREEVLRAMEERFAAVEEKVSQLEARIAEFEFKGSWEENKAYQRGNFVSHGGALFHANSDTKSKPGNGSGDWILAVARGRDGRDG